MSKVHFFHAADQEEVETVSFAVNPIPVTRRIRREIERERERVERAAQKAAADEVKTSRLWSGVHKKVAALAVAGALVGAVGVGAQSVAPITAVSAAQAESTVPGIDVSRWQQSINWAAVAGTNVKFPIIKQSGSDNVWYVDSKYRQNVQGARSAGYGTIGHYYFNGTLNGRTAAEKFSASLVDFRDGDWLVYDAENWSSGSASPANAFAFLTRLHELRPTGKLVLYTGQYLTTALNWQAVQGLGYVDLWVAKYYHDLSSNHTFAVGYWSTWAAWQYSSSGRVNGISGNVDMNVVKVSALNGATLGGGSSSTTAASSYVPSGTYLGYDIKTTQRLLNANGASLAVDGLYGPATRAAVRAFQAAHGLTVDGLAGPRTQAALRGSSASAGSLLSVDGVVGPATISRAQQLAGTTVDGVISWQSRLAHRHAWRVTSYTMGTYGSQLVRAIQRRIGVTVDGQLGPATIRAMQRRLGVKVDGYLGPVTARAWQARLNAGSLI